MLLNGWCEFGNELGFFGVQVVLTNQITTTMAEEGGSSKLIPALGAAQLMHQRRFWLLCVNST